MEFQVDVASRIPIYRQLRDQIRQAVAQGQLQPEDRLPSVRELSRTLVVNPNTIARVYTELERENVLNTRPGLGVFVATPHSDLTRKSRRERFIELLDAFLTDAVHLGMSHDEVQQAVADRARKFQWPGQRQ
jgi:GntR family transcriptional regulator